MLTNIFNNINSEYFFAISKYEPFNSAHEGLAIIREEYKELEQEVFKKQSEYDMGKMNKEALQLATMAIRFIVDSERWKV